MRDAVLEKAFETLGAAFARRDWKFLRVPARSPREKTYAWPGRPDERIMVCVHKGPVIRELFHRQDFFFFNFAYRGDYGALSYRFDNRITVHENECYIGQPYAGYALSAESAKEIVIVGVLFQRGAFFRTFFPALSGDPRLFRFFLAPRADEWSENSSGCGSATRAGSGSFSN